MSKWISSGLLWLVLWNAIGTTTLASELNSVLEMVAGDAAVCLEIPHLDETWNRLETGAMIDRLRQFPPLQRFLESQGFRHWKSVDDHVARQTGSSLSSQLRAVFGKSLVLAIDVPSTGEPRGVLLGEAMSAEAIRTALATWNKLESNGVVTTKTHHGLKYLQRKREAAARESQFVAIHERWFAVSDHESMIQNVIDRFQSLTSAVPQGTALPDSLAHSTSFIRNRGRLNNNAVAFVHINARPWDRGLEEGTQGANDPIQLAKIWKNVNSVSAGLRIDRGIVCESVIELNPERLGSEWSRFASTAASPSTWISRIPDDALVAVAGRLEIVPAIRYLLNQMPAHDRTNLAKIRRVVQSLTGGHDLLEKIIPDLARDFGGFITPRVSAGPQQAMLDGAIGFTSHGPDHATLLANIDRGLDSGLSLLAAYLSAEAPLPLTVQRDQTDGMRLRSLSGNAFFPLAYGLQENNLVLAGSRTRLIQTLESSPSPFRNQRLSNASERFFAGMNQLIWFDAVRTRKLVEERGPELAQLFSHGSAEEAEQLSKRFEQVRPYLGLFDAAFLSASVEADQIRIVIGGSLDSY